MKEPAEVTTLPDMDTEERAGGCWALVPLKAPGTGKGRLTPVLGAPERARLMRAMFAHVLDALAHTPTVDRIAVVTPDAGSEALPPGVLVLPDAGGGVNEAITQGARTLEARGASRLVVLLADLPCLQASEVAALIEASRSGGLAIAPDRRESGTNALCLALPADFHFRFGTDSFTKHLAEAAAHARTAAVVRLPGLAFDVDEPEDLALLREQAGGRFGLERATGT